MSPFYADTLMVQQLLRRNDNEDWHLATMMGFHRKLVHYNYHKLEPE